MSKVIFFVINLIAEGGSRALARNVKFQRWVHLTNHRLFGTPLPKEEEYYQQFLKNKQREEQTHSFKSNNYEKRETLVEAVAEEMKNVLADMIPGGKKWVGKKDDGGSKVVGPGTKGRQEEKRP